MARDYEKCRLYSIEYKNHSYYGNPSYWVAFADSEGNYHRGYTASNSGAGYTIQNYRYAENGQTIYLDYHFTKKGTCIIDCIKHDSPSDMKEEEK